MATRSYLNFDLLLEQEGEGRYQARVTASPLGETPSVRFQLPFDATTLENLLLKLDPGRSGTRRVGATSQQQAAMEFGGPLFQAVFTGDLALAWQRSLDKAQAEQSGGVRLRLRLNDAPAIAGLPWELLYDAKTNNFLAQSERTPVVRFLDVPQVPRPIAVDGPLRVLAIISAPIDLDELDVEAEWQRIRDALAPRVQAGQVVVDRLPSATLLELGAWLRKHDTHVIHFVGHGDFDDGLREGVIYFQDQHGRSSAVTSSKLGPYLRDHDPLRMVVLNACRSARADAADPFAGMAQGLVQQDATAVVAMQFPISDRAAVTFTGEFYGALVDGLPVDQAVSSARKSLLADFGDEWSTPVLFLRSPDGNIFENVHALPGGGGGPTPSFLEKLVLWARGHVRVVAGAAAAVVLAVVAAMVLPQLGDDGGGDGGGDTPGPDDVRLKLPEGPRLPETQLLVAAGDNSAALNIFRFDTDDPTAGLTPLTFNTRKTWLPVLINDRHTMIFSVLREGTKGDFTLFTATSDGHDARRLFDAGTPDECNEHTGRPAVIPGTEDLVMRCRGDDGSNALVRADVHGENVVTLVNLVTDKLTQVNDPTVSFDGKTLVFWGSHDPDEPTGGDGDLYWLDLTKPDRGYHELLIPRDGMSAYSDAVFSPKTNMLAWRATLDGTNNFEVFAAPFLPGRLDLGKLEQISDGGEALDQDPMFSPDGSSLVYAHVPPDDPSTPDIDESKTQQLWEASVTAPHDPQEVSNNPPYQAVPAWSNR
jgi:hypothetical protein